MIEYFSHSQFATYAHCGLKYKLHYINKIKSPVFSTKLIFGNAVHRALEYFHKSQIWTLCTKDELFNEFEVHWYNLMTEHDATLKWKTKKDPDRYFNIGLDILNKYYDIHKDSNPPLMVGIFEDDLSYHVVPAVEVPFYLDRGADKIPIKGIIDLITTDENGALIIDHKTTDKEYDSFQIKTNMQLAIYSMAFSQMLANGDVIDYDIPEHTVGFDFLLKDTKTETGEIKLIKRRIIEEDVYKINSLFDDIEKGITNKIFLPNYGIHCGYCDYKDSCYEYNFMKGEVNGTENA